MTKEVTTFLRGSARDERVTPLTPNLLKPLDGVGIRSCPSVTRVTDLSLEHGKNFWKIILAKVSKRLLSPPQNVLLLLLVYCTCGCVVAGEFFILYDPGW